MLRQPSLFSAPSDARNGSEPKSTGSKFGGHFSLWTFRLSSGYLTARENRGRGPIFHVTDFRLIVHHMK
jgi:hypothetical protein